MKGYERIAVQITNLLRAHPRGLTITAISRTLHLNRNSVAKYLEILQTSGHVERERVGRAKIFFLSQRVPISAMLNFSSDMILILDELQRIWYVNDNLLSFEAMDRADFIGKAIGEARPLALSDPEVAGRMDRPFEGAEFQKEVTVRKGDATRSLSVSLVSTIFEDGSQGVTAIAEDITQRKEAERRLREHLAFFQEVLDRVPTPVFYKDTGGRYLGCNLAFEEYTGKPRSGILGRRAPEILPRDLAEKFEGMDAVALETGRTQSFESASPTAGNRRTFIVFKAPFLNPDGTPGGLVGTIFDITNQKQAEERLRARAEDLETKVLDLERACRGRLGTAGNI